MARKNPSLSLRPVRRYRLTLGMAAAAAGLALAGTLALSGGTAATFTGAREAENGQLAGVAAVRDTSATASMRFVTFGVPGEAGARRSIKGQPLHVRTGGELLGRPAELTDYQMGRWIGNWTPDVAADVDALVTPAAAAGKLALIVAYNIPDRDCSGASSGGAGTSAAYRAWIDDLARGVGNRKAIIIVEPDALAMVDCLTAANQAVRIADIAYAVGTLQSRTQASVYIDAGHSNWRPAAGMADLLKRAGAAQASGFALNVSNFRLSSEAVQYGEQLSGTLSALGIPASGYVIDTGRNGRGPAPDSPMSWCNPPDRGLGRRPTTSPAEGAHNHGYLWIKVPGESDGECGRGEPAAGAWFPQYARTLIDNAVY